LGKPKPLRKKEKNYMGETGGVENRGEKEIRELRQEKLALGV